MYQGNKIQKKLMTEALKCCDGNDEPKSGFKMEMFETTFRLHE